MGRTKRQYKSINKLQETEGSQIDLLLRTNLTHFSKGKLEEDMYPKKMLDSLLIMMCHYALSRVYLSFLETLYNNMFAFVTNSCHFSTA